MIEGAIVFDESLICLHNYQAYLEGSLHRISQLLPKHSPTQVGFIAFTTHHLWQLFSGEVEGKLHIAVHAHMWYIRVHRTFITREYTEDCKDVIQRPKKGNMDLHAACLVNSSQGNNAGGYSDYTTQSIKTLALNVIQVLDSRNYFQSC